MLVPHQVERIKAAHVRQVPCQLLKCFQLKNPWILLFEETMTNGQQTKTAGTSQ